MSFASLARAKDNNNNNVYCCALLCTITFLLLHQQRKMRKFHHALFFVLGQVHENDLHENHEDDMIMMTTGEINEKMNLRWYW